MAAVVFMATTAWLGILGSGPAQGKLLVGADSVERGDVAPASSTTTTTTTLPVSVVLVEFYLDDEPRDLASLQFRATFSGDAVIAPKLFDGNNNSGSCVPTEDDGVITAWNRQEAGRRLDVAIISLDRIDKTHLLSCSLDVRGPAGLDPGEIDPADITLQTLDAAGLRAEPLLPRPTVSLRLVGLTCGDAIVDSPFEDCDEGGVSSRRCDANCTSVVCGDGFTNEAAGERCDVGHRHGDPECDLCGRVCADVTEDGVVRASDALGLLAAATVVEPDCPLFVCDVNGSKDITATDALLALRIAVELPVSPACN